MRTAILFFVLLFYSLTQRGQIVISSCSAPDSVVSMYRKSADKLAVRRVDYVGDTYKDSVSINRQISHQYLKALLAVYNATALPARDTIVAIPIVLDNYPLSLNMILVDADSTKTWMQNLRNNMVPCGEPAVDYLITKYYLKKDSYVNFAGAYAYHGVSFRTDSNCYIRRLCDLFGKLMTQGVVFSQPLNEALSYSADIRDSINVNFTELTYSVGWGEWAGCLSPNCPFRRFWKFRVYNDCSVEYKGCYGDPLPPNSVIFPGIFESDGVFSDVRIFPNPTKDKLSVSFADAIPGAGELVIANTLGQTVYRLGRLKKEQEINVDSLPPGVYSLILRNSSGRKQIKFLKQ